MTLEGEEVDDIIEYDFGKEGLGLKRGNKEGKMRKRKKRGER